MSSDKKAGGLDRLGLEKGMEKIHRPAEAKKRAISAYISEELYDQLREYRFLNKGVSMNDCVVEGLSLFFQSKGKR